jgi:chaperone modulatory protein CbpM
MAQRQIGIEGVLLDEHTVVSITELTQVCGVSIEQVQLMVGEGMLQPRNDVQPEQWRFTGVEVRRARRAVRLQRDLDLNLPGTALALELIEELEHLRRRVRSLERQLGGVSDGE